MLNNRTQAGFTLIEVAVCSAVLSFSILTALAIIPRGLVIQNESRMRAVASVCIECMAANAFDDTIVNKWLTATPTTSSSSPLPFANINWNGQRVGIGVKVTYPPPGPPVTPGLNFKSLGGNSYLTLPGGDKKVYRMKDFAPPTLSVSLPFPNGTPAAGRLDRRIVYTVETTTASPLSPGAGPIYPPVNEITAWLLNKDPDQVPTDASYLATYVEQKKLSSW